MATVVQPFDYYKQIAENELSPNYGKQLLGLQTSLKSNNAALDAQVGQTNQNYDSQVGNAQLNGKTAQNNYSNQSLARGLGRSTIATTGLASIGDSTNRIINSVNQYRTNALNDIANQRTLYNNNYNNSANELDAEKLANINSRANELMQADKDQAWKEAQAAEAKREFDTQMAENKRQFDVQTSLKKLAASGGGSGSGSSGSTKALPAVAQKQIDSVAQLLNSGMNSASILLQLKTALSQATNKTVRNAIQDQIDKLTKVRSQSRQYNYDLGSEYLGQKTHRQGGNKMPDEDFM